AEGHLSENKSHHENLRKKPRQEDLQKKRLQEVVEKKLEQGLQNKPRQENLRKKPLQENLHNKPRQKPLHDKPCREGSQKKPLQELVEKKIQEFSQNQRRRVDLRKKLLHENLRKELPRLEYSQSKPHQELCRINYARRIRKALGNMDRSIGKRGKPASVARKLVN
ncbi:hypothetical protein J3459_008397, partial [Metarhizium acridum]